jgi:aromatic ring-cleaving dioxygenase
MNFEKYHFHIYFESNQLNITKKMVEKLSKLDYPEIGRIWERPVGPHPTNSCQITIFKDNFHQMTEWFLNNRNGLSIFVHAVTGNDLIDHTDYVMWIGRSYELNIEFFS